MSTIVWLEQASGLALVGGKAANLGELMRAGFEVPRGFVVTTEAYHRRDPEGAVPPGIADEIRAACQELVGEPGARVAVRSSATAEDLAEASFAGQQETFLDVAGENVVGAVAGCWASLFSERAVAYRRERDMDESGLGIAVVVQLMVPARAAGVMFTANPVTGKRGETLITVAFGLGEAVVAGTVNPDTFVIDRTNHSVTSFRRGDSDEADHPVGLPSGRTPEPLSREQAIELAGIGDRIETHFGVPQDVEWALDAAGFHLLQARPITALPEPTTEVPDEWPSEPGNMYFRASIVEQLPDPLTPLFADLMAEAVPTSLQALMDDLGEAVGRRENLLAGLDIGFPTINGYAYYRYANDAMRRVTGASLPAVRLLLHEGGRFFLKRWREQGLPEYRAAVAAWSGREPAGLETPELLAGAAELLAAGCRYYTFVQTIIPLSGAGELSWHALHRGLVGVRRETVETYLLGLDSAPLRAEQALWQLGRWVLADDALATALADPALDARGPVPAGVRAELWEQWRQRFAGYLAEYGHTVYNLDFVNPVPADDPAPILQALRFVLSGAAVDPFARQARLAENRARATAALLDALDPVRRGLVARSLEWMAQVVPAREDALAAQGLAWPVMRRLLAEFGRRLVAAGVLTEPEQVFWLTRVEAGQAAAGQPLPGLADRIAERAALHRGRALLRPPQYLPVNRLMTVWDRFLPAKVDAGSGEVLRGNAGSGGVVTGPARVISGPSDFADFTPGEILVAEITTPAYTPLFAVAGGVVTDIGGVLSHGSIVAREYGIPAVLGTGAATSRIATGDVITVDGGRGEVRLAGAEPAAPGRAVWPWLVAGAVAGAGAWWWYRRATAPESRPADR
ncbi:MAG: phosphoenolpyruvate synthase [Actinobacteria bacterium]|nr:phosphoenolpyruvate synthase [Actinomycetota bacterium]